MLLGRRNKYAMMIAVPDVCKNMKYYEFTYGRREPYGGILFSENGELRIPTA